MTPDPILGALGHLAEVEPWADAGRALKVAVVAAANPGLTPAQAAEVAAEAFDPRAEAAAALAEQLRGHARLAHHAAEYGLPGRALITAGGEA